jgi:hypothetical protein
MITYSSKTTSTKILISPPATRPGLSVLIAGVVAIAFTPSLLMPNSESETVPRDQLGRNTGLGPAEPQRWALAMGHASVSGTTGTVDRPTVYRQFCQNSPTLCDRAAPTPSS